MYRHISSGVESGSCKVCPAPLRRVLCPALCQIYNCHGSLDWLRAGVCFIGSISSVRDRCALQMAIRKPPLDRSIAGS